MGMVAGSAVLSFHLAFTAPEFLSAAAKMEGSLANSLAGVGDVLEAVGLTYNKLAQIIIGLIIFVFMLIAVILIAVFVPKLIDKARDGVIFRSIDGVLGAIALTAVVVGLLLVVGALAKQSARTRVYGRVQRVLRKKRRRDLFLRQKPFEFLRGAHRVPADRNVVQLNKTAGARKS